jgi:CDP-glucose 4,6-dehydratase
LAIRQSTLESLVMERSFWHGRRVFLTGHTGFKGSWLSLWLQHLGAEVVGFALAPPTTPSLFEIAGVAQGMTSIIGDIRDFGSLCRAMRQARPEVVIHMAAQPLVRYSFAHPLETYATNVMGTAHVLEALRVVDGVRAAIVVTSDKCYENREWLWGYRENEPLGGYDPYSSSKACAELVTSAYRSSFFNPANHGEHSVALASVRAGNVIGGGDWAVDRLIPDFVRAIQAGQPIRVRNPDAIRPWQHVLEPLGGYLMLAERLHANGTEFAESWNFGPADADAKSVSWIVEQLTAAWGNCATWTQDCGQQPHEATCLRLDSAKASARLDWRPKWSVGRALETVIEWHKSHRSGKDMRTVTLEQIQNYIIQ